MSFASIGMDVGIALQLICSGNHSASCGDVVTAEKAYKDAVDIYKTVLIRCPFIVEYETDIYRVYKKLATMYHTAGCFDKAIAAYANAVKQLERLVRLDNSNKDKYIEKISSIKMISAQIVDSDSDKRILIEEAIKSLEELNCRSVLLAIAYKTKGELIKKYNTRKSMELYHKALHIAESEKNDEICEEVAAEIKDLIRTFE